MRLGPQGFTKIALLGSAPSSTLLAPFNDPSWAIWCTSPSVFASVADKRSDVWFETHRWLPSEPGKSGAPGTRPWFSPEFRQFLREYKGTVFMYEPHPDIPGSVAFPFQELVDKYGPYFFTSSVAWMIAMAIEQKPETIGLFGIDMAAGSEWAYQRPGCQHFVGMAKAMGINIVLPPESDLMRHSTLYGIGEHNSRHIKLRERKAELEANKATLQSRINQDSVQLHYVSGALDQLNYFMELWTDDIEPEYEQAFSFSGSFVKPVEIPKAETPKPVAEEPVQKPVRKSKGNGKSAEAYA